MIGYKATYNYICRDQIYEVGREYKIYQPLEICKVGLHYCKVAKKVLTYYPIKPGFKLLEIEDLSSDTINDRDKSCTNHIRIVREITDPDELLQLLGLSITHNESTVTFKISDLADWYERTYDLLGNELVYKHSNGFSYENIYDSNGKLLIYKDSHGNFKECTRDQFGNLLSFKDSNGNSSEYTYDESGNELTYKDSWFYSC
jgi:YD repeat-containing protein